MNGFAGVNGLTPWRYQILYSPGKYETQQHKTTQIIQKEKKKNMVKFSLLITVFPFCFLIFIHEKGVKKALG